MYYYWGLLLFIIVSAGTVPLEIDSSNNVIDDKSYVKNSVESENSVENIPFHEDHVIEHVENDVPENHKEPYFIPETPEVDDPSHHDSEHYNEEQAETNEVNSEDTQESEKQPIVYILEYILPPYHISGFPSLPSLPQYFPNFSWLSNVNFPNYFPNFFSNKASEVILVEAE